MRALPTQPLKTYIVEDSRVIRENLIATLEELVPVEVVGTAEELESFEELVRPHGIKELVRTGRVGLPRASATRGERRRLSVLR